MKAFEKGTNPQNPLIKDDEVWLNDKYQVNIKRFPNDMIELSIKRLDKESIHDWRDLQTIKNMLASPEREAVELYPAETRLVDSSNQYYLWVMPEGFRFPFGFGERFIVKGHKGGWHKGSGQREFNKDEEPADAITRDEAEIKLKEYTEEKLKAKNG